MIDASHNYTARELSDLLGVSTRTVYNRLAFLRQSKPECYEVVKIYNGRPQFKYKGKYLTVEMLTDRNYSVRKIFHKNMRNKKKSTIDYEPPPVTVEDKQGRKYNLIGVKALLRVVTNASLFERFTALTTAFWFALLVYFWRM